MSEFSEIEAAAAKLPRSEQAKLIQFLTTHLSEAEEPKPRAELLKKWRARSSGLVEKFGGTKGYLDAVRGRDENCH